MQIFAVFELAEPELVGQRVQGAYPDNFYRMRGSSFFIATSGETSWEVANKIGLGNNSISSGIIVSVSGYWGHYDPALWEWIGVKMAADA